MLVIKNGRTPDSGPRLTPRGRETVWARSRLAHMTRAAVASPSLATLRSLVPTLAPNAYKGQAGKVGVIGGCADYTGAPYYAAISALKLGVRAARPRPLRARSDAWRPTDRRPI